MITCFGIFLERIGASEPPPRGKPAATRTRHGGACRSRAACGSVPPGAGGYGPRSRHAARRRAALLEKALGGAFAWYPVIGESDEGLRSVMGAVTFVRDGDDVEEIRMEELVLAKVHGLVGDTPSSVTPETIGKDILPRFVSRNRYR